MSDREGPSAFSHRILISMPGDQVLVGCCRRGLHAAADVAVDPDDLPVADFSTRTPDGWARLLPDLAPAVEARLAATPGPTPRATKAGR